MKRFFRKDQNTSQVFTLQTESPSDLCTYVSKARWWQYSHKMLFLIGILYFCQLLGYLLSFSCSLIYCSSSANLHLCSVFVLAYFLVFLFSKMQFNFQINVSVFSSQVTIQVPGHLNSCQNCLIQLPLDQFQYSKVEIYSVKKIFKISALLPTFFFSFV